MAASVLARTPRLTSTLVLADWLERTLAAAFAAAIVAMACAPLASTHRTAEPSVAIAKIDLPLDQLREDGLYGPPNGLRALSYEFCVPDDAAKLAEVRAIDPTTQFMPGARGRIGCGPGTLLVIGSTHQSGWRDVLGRLASLSYVEGIAEATFE